MTPLRRQMIEDMIARGFSPATQKSYLRAVTELPRFHGKSPDRLSHALTRVRALGMEPVLGDGLGTEIGCWMEASVARTTIQNAGEFNGFLKPRDRLFADPLRCEGGALVLPPGAAPRIDRAALARHTLAMERYAAPRSRGAAE